MSRKDFAYDDRGYVFTSDKRDIGVPAVNRQDVYDWGVASGVAVEYQGTLFGTDVWRVRNEQHRVLFLLKWI